MLDAYGRTVTVTQEGGNYKLVVVDSVDGTSFTVVHASQTGGLNTVQSMKPAYMPNGNSPSPTPLLGTSGGTVYWTQPYEEDDYKKVMIYLLNYKNSTASNQVITFTTPFINPPIIVANNTGLTLQLTNSTLTIVSPNNASPYSGNIIIEGA